MRNINNKFVGKSHNKGGWEKFASIAAVIALMVCSFAVGSVVMAKKQEVIKIDNFGISVILPDSWAGKYGHEIEGNSLGVYLLAQRNDKKSDYKDAGYLFWIDCLDEVYPMDYIYPEPGFTIATTANNTYRLRYPSDVQYDPRNAKITKEYTAMNNSIRDIQILLTDWMKNNSTNAF